MFKSPLLEKKPEKKLKTTRQLLPISKYAPVYSFLIKVNMKRETEIIFLCFSNAVI